MGRWLDSGDPRIERRLRDRQSKKVLEQFGERVRTERVTRGLSQERLAVIAGLDRTYIGGIERGERNVALANIVKIARALGVTTGTLLHGLEEV